MSRPPRPHPPTSTGAGRPQVRGRLDYLPPTYADLLALADNLGVSELGRPAGQSDTAATLMQLSSLVGHVLASYQRQYAQEAFIGTAQAPSSLVRHAHRLGSDPDPGLAAAGHVVLVVKPGLSGTVEAGLPLASVPFGQSAAQDYETQTDLAVDSGLNELLPADAERPVVVRKNADRVRVRGIGLGLRPGDVVAMIGADWQVFAVTATQEDPTAQVTTVHLDGTVSARTDVSSVVPAPVLLAHPTIRVGMFGAAADPVQYPPTAIRSATDTPGTGNPTFAYTAQRTDKAQYSDNDVYLGEAIEAGLSGFAVRDTGAEQSVLQVTGIVGLATVTLNRSESVDVTPNVVTITPIEGGGFKSTVTPAATQVLTTVRGHISGTVTVAQFSDQAGRTVPRSAQPVETRWLAGWALTAPLADTEPNDVPLTQPMALPGLLTALTPGRPLVFTDPAQTRAQVVSVSQAVLDETAGVTRIRWDALTPAPAEGWTLDQLVVRGNAAAVSHGRTVTETLGGSDGTTAYQRFGLRESPVTVLPGAAGGEPQIEVRVGGVRWDRVEDFAASGPADRHYRLLTDERGVSTAVFGDGRSGAVPPSGAKSVTATYRFGLGRDGDVEPRRLSRLKRAHPLLERVVNLTAISGGAQPAGPADIRTQATRWIRTFDRAVSVADLADLALSMPGIARAAASWEENVGAVLVVATAAGGQPAIGAVRAFLDARRDTGVPLVLTGPSAQDLVIVLDVEPDPAWLPEIVKNSVRTALTGEQEGAPGLFTFPARGLGQPAFLSEVYALLEALPGVVSVRIDGFAAAGSEVQAGGGPADVVTAGVREWIRLLPQNLTVTTSAPGRVG